MRPIKLLIYCSILFILFSCKEDFFDSVTEVPLPEHEPQLSIGATINASFPQTAIVRVSSTLSILDTSDFQPVTDAQVMLYEEDDLNAVFRDEHNAGWYTSEEALELTSGKSYTLKIDSPTFGSIEATQILPEEVEILSASYQSDNAIDIYGERVDEVIIEFNDPKDEENYYIVSVLAAYPFENEDTSFVLETLVYDSPVDPILEQLPSGLFFNDVSFEGENYRLRVGIELREAISYNEIVSGPPEKLTINLTTINKDFYLFQKTFDAFWENEGNPFAEPVIIHENIEGGAGLFSLMITNEFSIDL